ncbi:HlyD family secretion protein [Acuticoccus sediminis]|uniref:HlyD family secretion protein n=1 Tax=Acuticoccus sediminis TaxID=2184697 RepID=UPI001CFDA053|nr:HlyD family secretion protein [Acuticoccus sediminis]
MAGGRSAAPATAEVEPREIARQGSHPAPAAATEPPAAAPEKPRRSRKRSILFVILAVAASAGGYLGYDWWTVGRFELSTDDAYLAADMSILAAKVSGYVTSVEVTDNQAVRQGDVIARIDDVDYRLAVRAAQDRITVQKAAIERMGVQIDAARTSIDEADANVASAEAELTLTDAELDRKSKLMKTDYASRQSLDIARADHEKAVAALAASKAAKAAAEANVSVLEAERTEAEASLSSLQTALAQAERDLSFTVVRAPIDGVIGNKAVEVGELVQSGTRLAAVVPLASVYVDANFKETQLEDMEVGQTAEVTVDAFPGRVFEGQVESISPASGALFSLLPPENATGNFTKIVQRLPVRVALSHEVLDGGALRPGMSAVVTVDMRTGPATAQAHASQAAPAGAAAASELGSAPEATPADTGTPPDTAAAADADAAPHTGRRPHRTR